RDHSLSGLMINVILSVYLVIGTFLEERKLVLEFGDKYQVYQLQVSMFIPFKWLESKLYR
ncbi:MAG: methyltransferase family protein, partial [Candidatus Aminicenantales bacterium]